MYYIQSTNKEHYICGTDTDGTPYCTNKEEKAAIFRDHDGAFFMSKYATEFWKNRGHKHLSFEVVPVEKIKYE